MDEPTTPEGDDAARRSGQHYPTPTKAKIQGTIDYLQAKGWDNNQSDVFKFFGVTGPAGRRIMSSSQPRQHHNNPTTSESRGRLPIITPEQIREMEQVIENEGLYAQVLTWQQLGTEVGIDVHWRTIQQVMGSKDYRKCVACRKGWVSKKIAQKRLDFAKVMLECCPNPEDWDRVRFSDEVHFGWGPQGKLRIIRKPGQWHCADCIQYQYSPEEKDLKWFHCWAAVGYNFKSDIYFYDVPGNTNRNMSQQVYINQILELVVKPWLDAGEDFALEEDGDSGHGPGKANPVRAWKEKHNLKFYFNCPASPDLAPIENAWQPAKQYLKKYPHWDDQTMKELIVERWAHVSQESINKNARSMPDRLRSVLVTEGKMTGY